MDTSYLVESTASDAKSHSTSSNYTKNSNSNTLNFPDPSIFCDTLKADTYIVISRILQQLKIWDILKAIYPHNQRICIIDIISYIIFSKSNVFCHYEFFTRQHLQLHNNPINDVVISRILSHIVTEERINTLMYEWNNLHNELEKIYINYDSINFNCTSENISLAKIVISYISVKFNNTYSIYKLMFGIINTKRIKK